MLRGRQTRHGIWVRLRPLGDRADHLVLKAKVHLTGGFASARTNDTIQRTVEIILGFGHLWSPIQSPAALLRRRSVSSESRRLAVAPVGQASHAANAKPVKATLPPGLVARVIRAMFEVGIDIALGAALTRIDQGIQRLAENPIGLEQDSLL